MTQTKRDLFCEFTWIERQERAGELSQAVIEHVEVEVAKANAAKDFKERMDYIQTDIKHLARAIRANGEFRPVDCEWLMHRPNDGFKTLVRADTGEIVQTEPMGQHELQDELFTKPWLAPSGPQDESAIPGAKEIAEAAQVPTAAHGGPLESTSPTDTADTLGPGAEVDRAIDEAVDAAIQSTPADVVEIAPAKPEIRRPRGFSKPAQGRGVM